MIRALSILLAFATLTLVLLPFQLAAMALGLRLQRTLPHCYHRILCALIGVRISEVGTRSTASPALILSNHVSWLDICVISALSPMVFVAKHEVARWPVFGWLARLQRTIFINRQARHQTGAASREIAGRLLGGDAVVLFAEGTSSDGIRVLPFRSALVGAVHHALGNSTQHSHVTVQPMSLAYRSLSGVPLGRGLRQRVAWYGDAELIPHLLAVLASGAVDVTVSWGAATAHDRSADRKAITRDAERSVRRMTAAALRHAPAAQALAAEQLRPRPAQA
ncbi:MAG: lysophospholipid acyltransferase family protein [Bradyrhizobium sp.]|nr:lysophospholipid acyltransferase family protein [Bradyrhizobium sp.]